jgi:hypothetical protein
MYHGVGCRAGFSEPCPAHADNRSEGRLRHRRNRNGEKRQHPAFGRVDEEREAIEASAETLRCTTIEKA